MTPFEILRRLIMLALVVFIAYVGGYSVGKHRGEDYGACKVGTMALEHHNINWHTDPVMKQCEDVLR